MCAKVFVGKHWGSSLLEKDFLLAVLAPQGSDCWLVITVTADPFHIHIETNLTSCAMLARSSSTFEIRNRKLKFQDLLGISHSFVQVYVSL